jgi:hypothetical protein
MAEWPEDRHHATWLWVGTTIAAIAVAIGVGYYEKVKHYSWAAGPVTVAGNYAPDSRESFTLHIAVKGE